MWYKITRTYEYAYTAYVEADDFSEVENQLNNNEIDFELEGEPFFISESVEYSDKNIDEDYDMDWNVYKRNN